MLKRIEHEIGALSINMERVKDLCYLTVTRESTTLININGINSADMRKITKVLSDSPFIFSDTNK